MKSGRRRVLRSSLQLFTQSPEGQAKIRSQKRQATAAFYSHASSQKGGVAGDGAKRRWGGGRGMLQLQLPLQQPLQQQQQHSPPCQA